jgi:hypothetical protein
MNKWGQEVRTGSGLKVYGLESPITAQRPLSARGSTSLPTRALASAEVGGGRWFWRVQQTLLIVLYFSIH